ncbi:MAG TPA: hypothetical protein ENJ31_13500 [Anaerolineae bacterium]|nr:hypothetical protein [Anaerolineae bacterium]
MRKALYVLIVLTILASLSPAIGAQETENSLPPAPASAVSAQQYILALPLPEAQMPDGVRASDVAGYYHMALSRQQSEVEGLLRAMQERGWVVEYALYPQANTFLLTARSEAVETLARLGDLTEVSGRQIEGVEAAGFQRRFETAIQTAQAQVAPPKAPPLPQGPRMGPPSPTVPEPVDYLVRLVVSQNQAELDTMPHELISHLEWLRQRGEVVEYEWLPAAYAFRVRARGELLSLRRRPEVSVVAPYSDQAVQEARAAFAEAQATLPPPVGPLAATEILAYTPTTPTVTAWLYDDEIFASSYTNTTTVFTLTTNTGEVKDVKTLCASGGPGCDRVWSGSPGNYYQWVYFDWPTTIEPGNVLYTHQKGEALFSMDIPNLSARVDCEADTVSGVAPPNITSTDPNSPPNLFAWAQGVNHDAGSWQTYYVYMTTDANGNYTTSFTYTYPITGTLDLRPPNTYGYLSYANDRGNIVALFYHTPEVRVQENGYWVDGYAEADVMVTVTLKSGSGVVKGSFVDQANGSGWFGGNLHDVYGNSVKSVAGDVVEMEASPLVTVPVEPLTALADPGADTVEGQAPPNIISTDTITPPNLYVNVWGAGSQWVTSTVTGDYLADNVGDFGPGAFGETRYYNGNGDQVYINFAAPIVYVRGDRWGNYVRDNHVEGTGNPAQLTEVVLKRGGTTVATASTFPGIGSGWWAVDLYDSYGNPVDIQAGDTVEVTCNGKTTTVDIPTLTADADPDTDVVTGIGPADVVTTTWGAPHSLYVRVDQPSWTTLIITTTHSGAYSADFSTYGGIDPGSWGWLRYINSDGHYVYDDFQAPYPQPVVYVRSDYWNSRYYAENYVSGYVPNFCGSGSVTLKDSGGTVKAQATNVWACNSFGVYLYDAYGNPADIQGGGTVEATFGDRTTVVDVPEFDVTSDADMDTVSGSTNATVVTDTYGLTQTLAVWPTSYYDWDYGKYVTTTAGVFTATNPFYGGANPTNPPQTVDIYPGSEGHLRYVDADGNQVYARFQAPYQYAKPVVYVRGYYWNSRYYAENYVSGYVPNFCGYGSVTLKDSGGAVKAQNTSVWACNSFGVYLDDAYGNPVNIKAGDTVEAAFGDQTTVNVPAFDVDSDADNDRVTGVTNAAIVTDTYGLTQTLAVWPTSYYDWDYGKYVLPVSGAFTATNPFYWGANPASSSSALDWDPGQAGHLRYVDADGNRVYDRFLAPRDEPEIWVQENDNYVWGYVITPEGPVTVTLLSGGTVKATAYDTSDQWGGFDVWFYDDAGNPVTIVAGDEVVVQASAPVTVPVVPLTGQADAENDTVSGRGPANAQLNVVVDGWYSQGATTDGSGAYSADFRGLYDIQPGDQVEVQHRNDDGHTVYIRFYAGPKLYAQLDSYRAWGYAPAANIPVTVTLKSGGTVKGSDVTQSWNDNTFWAYLYDSVGQRAIISAGDTLEVDFGGGNVVTMTVTGMTADVDADADTIGGTGPANTPLGVEVGNFDQTVTTDGSGVWSADASGIEDITPGEQVLVRHINADYNETWLYAVAPVVYVRGYGSGATNYVADNYLSGYAANRATVNITLKRGGAVVATRQLVASGWNGYYSTYLYDALGLDADIEGNDQIVIAASPPFTLTVPDIQATVDADADTVSGTGPADADLGIYVNGDNQTTHTDASGVFTAAFTSIDPGDYAYIRYANPEGHWIHALFRVTQVGTPAIYARWDDDNDVVCDNCVSGQAGAANTVVSLALKRGGSTIAMASDMADNGGNYNTAFTDAAGEPVDILAGDIIEAAASAPVTMTVAALTAQANRETGILYGTGPANADIYYWYRYPWWGGYDGMGAIGPDGHYNFDLWLGNGATGYVRYTAPNGHRTYLAWAVSYAWVRENGNDISGYVERGVPVIVRLLGGGGVERGRATTTSSTYNGYFDVNLLNASGDPLIIAPNDIVVIEASPAITVPVVPLSAEVDVAADQVSGNGPTNDDLRVQAGDCWRNVTTDGSGAFTADVSGECDLQAGDGIGIYYWNNDGNEVYIEFNAPLVRVNPVNEIVDGYATPNSVATLTLKRAGNPIATATASTDEDGFFSAFFTDGSGNLVDIQPGDTVEVTASPTTSITVADLSATVDPDSDTVSGSGPANATLLVKAFAWTGWGWTSASKAAYSDGSGNFSVDFTGDLDLTDISYAYVRYSDANGHQSSVHTTPPRSPLLDRAEQDVRGQGAEVQASAFGAANDGDLTPPVRFNGGAGKLVFVSEGGSLVLTRPDGSVDDTGATQIIVDKAPTGEWQVQVRVWGGEGEQYAIAIGQAVNTIYLPLVLRGQ